MTSVTVCNVAEEFAKASLSFIVASLLEWLIEFGDSVEEMERRWGMIIGCNCVYRVATDRCWLSRVSTEYDVECSEWAVCVGREDFPQLTIKSVKHGCAEEGVFVNNE